MKQAVLITGINGAGKTSVSKTLAELGYPTCDMDRKKGLFIMVDKKTKQPVVNYSNANIGNVTDMEWICDTKQLKTLIENETAPLSFYCGSATNMNDILPLFKKIILLKVDEQTTRERLTMRTGRNDFGRTSEVQDWIMSWKQSWERKIEEKGAMVIDAHGNLASIAQAILEKVSA